MPKLPRVTVWNEYRHERMIGKPAEIYPDGLHAPIVAYLQGQGFSVRVATMDEPEHGLTETGAGADGCPRLVGSHGPPGGERRGRGPRASESAGRDGIRAPSLQPLLQDIQES